MHAPVVGSSSVMALSTPCAPAQGRSVQDIFEEMLLSSKCHTIEELASLWLKAYQSGLIMPKP